MKMPAGKVIITAALDGAMVTKDMNPNVPEQARLRSTATTPGPP